MAQSSDLKSLLPLHVNHQYLLNLAMEMNTCRPGARVLDYGCGNGEIVEEGRKRGLQIHGTDIFYDPNPDTRVRLAAKGLMGDCIREIRDGRIPFEDHSFDLVVSNMVFEHVENMETVLAELERVLKPGGVLVTMFPTQEVWRETHTGLPFVHWMKKGSVARRRYAFALRACGFGTFKSRPLKDWVATMLGYLDNYVYYRARRSVIQLLPPSFTHAWMDRHHIGYRLQRSPLRGLSGLLQVPLADSLAVSAFNRAAFVVLVVRKAGANNPQESPSWLPLEFSAK